MSELPAAGGEHRAPWRAIVPAVLLLAVSWVMALPDTVSGAEEWVFRVFNDLPDWLEAPSWPVMQLGAIAIVPAVAVAAYLAWRRWQPAAAVLGAGTAAWLLAKVIKEIVERGRPQAFLTDVNLRPEWEGLGFVSGHAAVAFAMATVLAPRFGRLGKALVWIGAVATGLLRMYTAAHLPLDVVGGAALGVALGSVALWVAGETRVPTGRGSS
jgi:undecaprenyl-diphosphatase